MTLEHLPLFIALGANSVFFDGEDSGLQAYRNKIFEQLPRAGLPYYFEEFFEMGELYEALHNSQTIESSRDIWWDVRINPIFKTVELRVCAQSVPAQWMYRQILRQNKWNAVRYGLDGIYQNKRSVYTLREHGKHLFEEMENVGVFDSLNAKEYLPKLYQLLNHPNPAYFQKECFEKHRCLSEVERLGIFKEKE
jgi:carboxylate-amine ligase